MEEHNKERVTKGLPIVGKKEWSEWPKDNKNNPKKDHSKLKTYELAPQVNLADPNHRCKVLGKHVYPLTKETKASGKQISKAYAERFKVNFNRALHQNRHKSADELRKGLLATLEHEFNNHEYCSDDWWKWLQAKDDVAKRATLSRRWMSKEQDKTLYESLHAIYMTFLTPERVNQMHHKYNTQKNEAMNHKIARLCPKNTTFSKSMVLSDRVAWVVAEDSIGGTGTLRSLYKLLGLGVPPPILLAYYESNDKKREHHRKYTQRPEIINRRRKAVNEKIRLDRALRVESEKKGQEYASGIAFDKEEPKKRASKPKILENRRCNACGASTHWRRSSSLCPHNKKNFGNTQLNRSYEKQV